MSVLGSVCVWVWCVCVCVVFVFGVWGQCAGRTDVISVERSMCRREVLDPQRRLGWCLGPPLRNFLVVRNLLGATVAKARLVLFTVHCVPLLSSHTLLSRTFLTN